MTKQVEKGLAVSDVVQAECVFVLCGAYRHGGRGVSRGGRQPAIDGALGISFEVQAAFTWILSRFFIRKIKIMYLISNTNIYDNIKLEM